MHFDIYSNYSNLVLLQWFICITSLGPQYQILCSGSQHKVFFPSSYYTYIVDILFNSNSIGIKYSGICHDQGSIKQGNLFYLSGVIIVRTWTLFFKILRNWSNTPPPPNTMRVKLVEILKTWIGTRQE